MINQLKINETVITGLEQELSCPVIFSNQTAPVPTYPYCSFTITNLANQSHCTYGLGLDEVYRKEIIQTWSFTIQSNDDDEAMLLTLKAYDFFNLKGKLVFSDGGVVVQNVTQISNRDNLVTIEYEHRYGFDVRLSICNEINVSFGEIDEVEFNKIH